MTGRITHVYASRKEGKPRTGAAVDVVGLLPEGVVLRRGAQVGVVPAGKASIDGCRVSAGSIDWTCMWWDWLGGTEPIERTPPPAAALTLSAGPGLRRRRRAAAGGAGAPARGCPRGRPREKWVAGDGTGDEDDRAAAGGRAALVRWLGSGCRRRCSSSVARLQIPRGRPVAAAASQARQQQPVAVAAPCLEPSCVGGRGVCGS